MALDVLQAIALVSGGVQLAIAAFLIAWSFSDRLNRTFGTFLAFSALGRLSTLVPDEPGVLHALYALGVYMALATPFLLLYVAAAYHDRYGRRRMRRLAFPILLIAALAYEVAYFLDHDVFDRGAGTEWAFALAWVSFFGSALMSAILAHDAARASNANRRHSLALASLGFAFYPTAWILHLWIPDLMAIIRGITPLRAAMFLAALVPIAYTAWTLARMAMAAKDPAARHDARLYLLVLAAAPGTVALLALVRATNDLGTSRIVMVAIMLGWTVVGSLLIAYAIARHQVFGVERQVKFVIQRGTLVAAFVAVFIGATQVLQAFLDQYSLVLGGVFAALVLLAVQPLSRLGRRLAEAAMPDVQDTAAYESYRRLQLYESALIAAWEDGRVAPAERSRLARLRRRLELSEQDVAALERDVARSTAAASARS